MLQARYTDPVSGQQVAAPVTFQTKQDADAWLSTRQADLIRGTWLSEARKIHSRTTLTEYADSWLLRRQVKPRTRAEYRRLLDKLIVPTFGSTPLGGITAEQVRTWYSRLPPGKPTQRARAYELLRTILGTAVADDLLASNPCRIKGGAQVKRSKVIRPATLAELEVIVAAMPARLRVMTLLSAWCALRFGESTELRRKDVQLERDKDDELIRGVLRVRRGVSRVKGSTIIGSPKSAAGSRNVAVPPHLLPLLSAHLAEHVGSGPDSLLFPGAGGQHLAPASLYVGWYAARHKAGRDDLRWHDLRHTGAVLAASTGATLRELMDRLGHSTPSAALMYQHSAADADTRIAEALSALVDSDTPETESTRRV
jgi:integrase